MISRSGGVTAAHFDPLANLKPLQVATWLVGLLDLYPVPRSKETKTGNEFDTEMVGA
jgi:hypothetical protein